MARSLTWLVLCAALAACAPAADTMSGSSVSRDSAGITITINRAPTLARDSSWSVQLQPLVEIGARQNDSSQILHEVHGATRLSDGRIVVANSAAPAIRWYDSTGKLLQSAGRAGAGPGELGMTGEGAVSLSNMWRVPGDTVAVWSPNMGVGRLLLFGPDTRYVRTIETESYALAAAPSVSPSSQSSSTTQSSPTPRPRVPQIFASLRAGWAATVAAPSPLDYGPAGTVTRDSSMYLVIGADGKIAAEIGWRATSFTHSVSIPFPGAAPRAMPLQPAFAPRFARAAGDGRIYYGYSDRYEIASYDDRGALRQSIRREFTRAPVTAKTKEEFRRKEFPRIPDGPMRQPMEAALEIFPFADSLPAFRNMRVDDAGMLWVQQYVVDGVTSAAWSVFDKSGRWVTDIELPTAWDIREIGLNYVIAVEKNALDVQTVRLFRLERR